MPSAPIPDLVTPELLRDYVGWLEARISAVTLLGLITDLSEFMRVACPDAPHEHLKRVERSLRWKAVPSKDKRSRLRPSEDLVRLGEQLMVDIHGAPSTDPRLPLARYRDGLAIALLALRPLRIRTFASLSLGEAITKRTRAAFGQAISPHFFRDCAATTLALDSPEEVRLAAPLLGHADPRITERHYNQAKSVDAGRRFLDAVQRSRRPKTGS